MTQSEFDYITETDNNSVYSDNSSIFIEKPNFLNKRIYRARKYNPSVDNEGFTRVVSKSSLKRDKKKMGLQSYTRRINYYSTGLGYNLKVRHAVTGHEIHNGVVGDLHCVVTGTPECNESLFHVSLNNGTWNVRNRNPRISDKWLKTTPQLYYLSPDEYEAHFNEVLPSHIREKWNNRQKIWFKPETETEQMVTIVK